MGNYDTIMKRTEKFRSDRFGLFIHWGLYAVRGTREWTKSADRIKDEDYQKYFEAFTAEHYDPKEWARIAKAAGMKYAVLTAKHHEGFCLFDSKYTDYKSTNSPAKRDLVREFVEAFRAEGLGVGLYYSLLDWHHPDYPHKDDRYHPMRGNADYPDEGRNFDNYIEYMLNQLRELMTNYGKIDILWTDFSYDNPNGESMSGEKWHATEIVKLVRSLQPDIVLDNRLSNQKFDDFDTQPFFAGDFRTPEEVAPDKPILDAKGRPIPWEMCQTSQPGCWGYNADRQRDYMAPAEAIKTLVDCVSKDGNLLLNVGPNGKGEIPPEARKLLAAVGEWMYENGESIYGCGSAPYPTPQWGRLTYKKGAVYAHVYGKSGHCVSISGLPRSKVKYAVTLMDNAEVPLGFWNGDMSSDNDVRISLMRAKLPDPIDTVIKLVLNE